MCAGRQAEKTRLQQQQVARQYERERERERERVRAEGDSRLENVLAYVRVRTYEHVLGLLLISQLCTSYSYSYIMVQ